MKYLISALTFLSLSVSAADISKEDFIKILKANETTLNKIDVGMSSKVVSNGIQGHGTCDDEGNCEYYDCEYEMTEEKAIIAIFGDQHYQYITQKTKMISTEPECSYPETVDTYIILKNNPKLDVSNMSFNKLVRIVEITKDIYVMKFEDVFQNQTATQSVRIDTRQSLFYFPLKLNYSSNWITFEQVTSVMSNQDPNTFDLSEIELCFEYPIPGGHYGVTCSEKDDYTYILR